MERVITYCDYNAGAPVRPEAAEAVARALALGGNPSSVHGAGRRAKALMEDARERIGAALGARTENIVFTSGATEALHLALEASRGEVKSLIISAIEHDAIAEHAPLVWPDVRTALVTGGGVIDLAVLENLLAEAPKPALVAVMLANNETGAIQPIAKVAALVRDAGGLLLVDGAQAVGRIEVDIADVDASYLVVSSHKLGGPQGAGALVLAPGAPFAATKRGGGQERGRRPGTENVAAIAGFGAALDSAQRDLGAEQRRLAALRDRFEAGLPRDAIVFGARTADAPAVQRLPNTSLFAWSGLSAETAVIAMDLHGVAVSSGAACSSGKVRASRVLSAMGVGADLAKSALRVSFGWASKEEDVDAALAGVRRLARCALQGAA